MSVTPDGWVGACLSALTCWRLPPWSSGWRRWKSPHQEQEFSGWGMAWPAVLNCTAGKVHRAWEPRRRENPRGKKAKQTKNKCKWKGSAKAPLHGLVTPGSCQGFNSWIHPRAPGDHKVLSTTDFVLSSSPWLCHTGSCLPWRQCVGLGQGTASYIWARDRPCAPEQGLHHNSAQQQAPPHCNGTFLCGFRFCLGFL